MNKQHFFRTIWRTATAAVLLLSAAVVGSCSNNDPDPGIPYFRLENMKITSTTPEKTYVTNASELGFDVIPLVGNPALELLRYNIRSNRNWVAECNSADASWLKIHPTEGSGDGIIRFCAYDNNNITPRSTTVVFRYSDGSQTQITLAVNQQLNPPYLKVSATENGNTTDKIEVERAAASFTVNLDSNVDYFYTSTKADWYTFKEVKHGVFQLDIQAYPENAAELERSAKIVFKGTEEHASLVTELPIHQSIVPYITITSKDLDKKDNFTPFEASTLTPITFNIRSNYNWTIEQPEDGSWYMLSQTEGEADKDYSVTITPLSKNTEDERTGQFTILASTISRKLTVTQEGGGAKPKPVEGFPVTWTFKADAEENGLVNREERWYKSDAREGLNDDQRAKISVYQPERNPSNPNMSYTVDADGELGRVLSFGFCLGDYWLFEVPEIKNLRAAHKIQLSTIMSSSAAGPKFFMLEYSTDDMETWTAVNVKTTTLQSVGRTVQHTVMLPYVAAANEDQVVRETFSISRNMAQGTLYVRLRVCDTRSNKDDKEILPKNGGTTRMKTRQGSLEQFSIKVSE